MLEKWWNDDFLEIVEGAKQQLLDKNRMGIEFLLLPDDEIQAYAAGKGTKLQYSVAITRGLRNKIYQDTNVCCIFDRSLKAMKKRYNCSDDLVFLRKVLCMSTWSLVLGHELGHVVNGHLGDGSSTHSVRKKGVTLTWTPGDPITNEMRIWSMKEYDADAYAGNWAGIMPSRLQFECSTEADRKDLGMSVVAMAAHYLVTLLSSLGEGYPWYPPNSMRVLTMTSVFLHSHQHVQKTGELIDRDHHISIDDLQAGVKYRAAIKEATEDLDTAGCPRISFDESTMKEWLNTLRDFKSELERIHDEMRQIIDHTVS